MISIKTKEMVSIKSKEMVSIKIKEVAPVKQWGNITMIFLLKHNHKKEHKPHHIKENLTIITISNQLNNNNK